MKYISHDGSDIHLELSLEELGNLIDGINEISNGPYSLSDEEWEEVMLSSRDDMDALLDALVAVNNQVLPQED